MIFARFSRSASAASQEHAHRLGELRVLELKHRRAAAPCGALGAGNRRVRRDRVVSQIENGPASRLAGSARVDFGKDWVTPPDVERGGMPQNATARSVDSSSVLASDSRRAGGAYLPARLLRSSPLVEVVMKWKKSKADRQRVAHEAEGATAGALAGAALGSAAGPPGIAAGAVIGGVAGVISGAVLDSESSRQASRSRELDAQIGVSEGDLGAPNLKHPPAKRGTYSAASAGVDSSARRSSRRERKSCPASCTTPCRIASPPASRRRRIPLFLPAGA
jgi:hypothetical protein